MNKKEFILQWVIQHTAAYVAENPKTFLEAHLYEAVIKAEELWSLLQANHPSLCPMRPAPPRRLISRRKNE